MKKIIYLFFAILFTSTLASAQTTAMDFTKTDCSGQSHHLYSELDSGYFVIMEFIMTCNSCIAAGNAIEAMISDLQAEYPGRVKWYQFAYTNSYSCATMTNFKNTNGFTSSVFDQGATLVAYYGGFGMPTISVAAGSSHDVLFTDVGFSISDTTAIGNLARTFFSTTAVNTLPQTAQYISTFPNPAKTDVTIRIDVKENTSLDISILDLSGKEILQFLNQEVQQGIFEKQVNVSGIANGNYFVRATMNGKTSLTQLTISH
jgi:hypothetical protein